MGYSIIFETKICILEDGRLLHLDLSGCNNDDCGRNRNEFTGKIYTKEDFIKYAESFMKDGKPETDVFELKIGSKYASYYDYGEHLLRMMKRATTWNELLEERFCYGIVLDGIEVTENNEKKLYSLEEWDKICHDFMRGKRHGDCYRKARTINTEEEIVKELEAGKPIEFMIGKKIKRSRTA